MVISHMAIPTQRPVCQYNNQQLSNNAGARGTRSQPRLGLDGAEVILLLADLEIEVQVPIKT